VAIPFRKAGVRVPAVTGLLDVGVVAWLGIVNDAMQLRFAGRIDLHLLTLLLQTPAGVHRFERFGDMAGQGFGPLHGSTSPGGRDEYTRRIDPVRLPAEHAAAGVLPPHGETVAGFEPQAVIGRDPRCEV
jgi:hypothetical protein